MLLSIENHSVNLMQVKVLKISKISLRITGHKEDIKYFQRGIKTEQYPMDANFQVQFIKKEVSILEFTDK